MRRVFVLISRVPPIVLLVTPVLCAIIVAFLVDNALKRPALITSAPAKRHELSTVIICTKDIGENQVLSNDFLEERRADTSKVPVDAMGSIGSIVGRKVKYAMSAGSVVSQRDLAPLQLEQGFESKLSPGLRAVTFPVDSNSGVAGFINPDSHVDILAIAGAGGDTKASPILSDVRVIAVGQSYHREQTGTGANVANSVTVAVNSADSQKLVKAIAASKLYLVLRSDNDRTPVATTDVTQLFSKAVPAPPQMALLPEALPLSIPQLVSEEQGRYVELWSGSRKELQKISR